MGALSAETRQRQAGFLGFQRLGLDLRSFARDRLKSLQNQAVWLVNWSGNPLVSNLKIPPTEVPR